MTGRALRFVSPAHGAFNLKEAFNYNRSHVMAFFDRVAEKPEMFTNANDRYPKMLTSLQAVARSAVKHIETNTTSDLSNPIQVEFRDQRFPLYTIYQEMAWILSVTGMPQSLQEAGLENYWVPLLATFSQWNRAISSDPKYAPYASSVCIFSDKSEESSQAFPFIMCSSGPLTGNENSQVKTLMRRLLDEVGFVDPRQDPRRWRLKNYGACAECWQWRLIKLAPNLQTSQGVALKRAEEELKTYEPSEVAKRLMPPCATCKDLARQANILDVDAQYGVSGLRKSLKDIKS